MGRRLGDRGCDPLSWLYLVQQISLTIRCGNAASLMGTMGPAATRNGPFLFYLFN